MIIQVERRKKETHLNNNQKQQKTKVTLKYYLKE